MGEHDVPFDLDPEGLRLPLCNTWSPASRAPDEEREGKLYILNLSPCLCFYLTLFLISCSYWMLLIPLAYKKCSGIDAGSQRPAVSEHFLDSSVHLQACKIWPELFWFSFLFLVILISR